MSDKPILFSGEMVKAILAGEKTQTRRVVNPQPTSCGALVVTPADQIWYTFPCDDGVERFARCPYGKIGYRLWVRETFASDAMGNCTYRATPDISKEDFSHYMHGKWKPSIFMPRWASRITLEVTGVRVEKVNKITYQDALSEGIKPAFGDNLAACRDETINRYARLWNSINSKRGFGWDVNPWVWVISFKRID